MARTPFSAEWIQAGSGIFQWGQQAAYWKGTRGWWASRKGHDGIMGPFRTPGAAQRWAEEPFREAHRARAEATREKAKESLARRTAQREARKARKAAQAETREALARLTWKDLPPEARRVEAGQVWTLRDARHGSREVLVVEVKKTIAVVLARDDKGTPWKGLTREPRTLSTLPRLYRLAGSAKVPVSAKG